jgi:hypothetical protein
MSGEYIGRGVNAGPASDIFPLSGSTASSAPILITATTATGGGTIAHTCDANAFDMPYIIISNVGATAATVYGNIGSLATTGNRQWTVSAGAFTTAYSYDVMQSKSGTFSFWSSATSGLYLTGVVARMFTASSAP